MIKMFFLLRQYQTWPSNINHYNKYSNQSSKLWNWKTTCTYSRDLSEEKIKIYLSKKEKIRCFNQIEVLWLLWSVRVLLRYWNFIKEIGRARGREREWDRMRRKIYPKEIELCSLVMFGFTIYYQSLARSGTCSSPARRAKSPAKVLVSSDF